MAQFTKPIDATVEEMKSDIDMLFRLFDHIDWLQFVGGEIFLHNGLAEVYRYCLQYRRQFDRLILESNATVLPTDDEIAALCAYDTAATVMISDYGELSSKRDEFLQVLERAQIPCIIKKYHGDQQHYGGWIDNTLRQDLQEPAETVAVRAAKCPQVRLENMHCYRGRLHRCSNSLFLSELGIVVPTERDFLSLHDESLSMEEKRQVIQDFYKHPRRSCAYCQWKDADNLPRYQAGEQLKSTKAME